MNFGVAGRVRLLLVLVLVGAAALVALLVTIVSWTHRPAPKPRPEAFVSDNFHRSDRNIVGDVVSGRRYDVQFDPGKTQLQIRNGRLVRGKPTNFGANGGPILIIPNPVVPSVIAVQYVFTPGTTMTDNVVVGSCAKAFGMSSIQFAVSPQGWKLLYTLKRAEAGSGTDIVPIESGTFATPLAMDGRTRYRTVIRVDLAKSSVLVEFPGATRTFTDPVIAKYWGNLMGVQIRRPLPTDGDAQITAIAEGPKSLQPFSTGSR